MDCLFCKIINDEIPSYTVYEDDLVKAFLDVYPDANGHTLIVPKKHFDNILDIDATTLTHINKVAKEIYELYKEKLGVVGISLNQNNDYGQEIKHYHLHLVPRYENDGYHSVCKREELLKPDEIYLKIIN